MNKVVGLHIFVKINEISIFAAELIYTINATKKLIKFDFAVLLLLEYKTFKIVIRW